MRLRQITRLLLYGITIVILVGCSTTRSVPEGRYRLRKNIIITDPNAPKNERFTEEELDRYVRPAPNRKFLGTNLYLWFYNAADSTKNNWLNRTLRRLGDPPVILDSTLTERSAENIRTYMRSHGFFDSELYYTVETKKKTARVTYYVTQNDPYRIGRISHTFLDQFLRPVVMRDSSKTLLRTGEIFNINTLNAERSRITDYLRNNGYYEFMVNNISYVADSTAGDNTVDLRMVVRQRLTGFDQRGEAEYENNRIYRISDIFINPDYDPVAAVSDPYYFESMDTLNYRGLNILYQGNRPKVRSKILRQSVNLYPNYLYSQKEVQEAYSNLMRLGYYRSATIAFDNVTDTTQQNLVTFIGADDDSEEVETTTEGYLQARINAIPALRQSYKIDVEGSGSQNFYAIGATVGYQNRNLLRGAELFDVSLTGRYEFMRTSGKNSSFEVGGSTSLSFPRFIAPFNVDPYNRRVNPWTKFEVSVNAQRRPYYRRTISSAKMGYSWSNRHSSSFTLRPVDINLIKVGYIDTMNFLNKLQNQYLIDSYSPQLIAGISGSFVYNTQMRNLDSDINSFVFRLNWETTGNLFSGLTHLFANPATDPQTMKEYYKLFGIRFAQYFRLDASVSNRLVVGPKVSVVYRVLAGGGLSYGNSTAIPSERLFYSGGANSMRGWIARTLGPGSVPAPEGVTYHSQLGNFKLEANLETRFPVWGFLQGAVFFDLGNIWFLKKSGDYQDEAVFRFERFYKQLGFNTGIGARFDFNFFIFRFDWGIKLHDPNQPAGQRWINRFDFNDTALTFGVGYPF